MNTKKLAKALAKRAAYGRRLGEPRNLDWLYSSGHAASIARRKRPKGLKGLLFRLAETLLRRMGRR